MEPFLSPLLHHPETSIQPRHRWNWMKLLQKHVICFRKMLHEHVTIIFSKKMLHGQVSRLRFNNNSPFRDGFIGVILKDMFVFWTWRSHVKKNIRDGFSGISQIQVKEYLLESNWGICFAFMYLDLPPRKSILTRRFPSTVNGFRNVERHHVLSCGRCILRLSWVFWWIIRRRVKVMCGSSWSHVDNILKKEEHIEWLVLQTKA